MPSIAARAKYHDSSVRLGRPGTAGGVRPSSACAASYAGPSHAGNAPSDGHGRASASGASRFSSLVALIERLRERRGVHARLVEIERRLDGRPAVVEPPERQERQVDRRRGDGEVRREPAERADPRARAACGAAGRPASQTSAATAVRTNGSKKAMLREVRQAGQRALQRRVRAARVVALDHPRRRRRHGRRAGDGHHGDLHPRRPAPLHVSLPSRPATPPSR